MDKNSTLGVQCTLLYKLKKVHATNVHCSMYIEYVKSQRMHREQVASLFEL